MVGSVQDEFPRRAWELGINRAWEPEDNDNAEGSSHVEPRSHALRGNA